MGGRVRCVGGGIRGLSRFLRLHQTAIEYDLIGLGLRLDWLGTHALTWRDLLVIVKHAPPGSALARDMQGGAAGWLIGERLSLAILNQLRVLSWQQAGKGRRPKPIDPPDVGHTTQFQGGGLSREEIDRRLGWA